MNNQIKQLLEKWSASINEKKYRETAQCYEPLTCNALMRQADKPMENEGVYNIETIFIRNTNEIRFEDAKRMLYDEYGEEPVVLVLELEAQTRTNTKYFGNGINFKLVSFVKYGDEWKIEEMIQIAEPEELLQKGYVFSENYKYAVKNMEDRRNGIFRTSNGELIGTKTSGRAVLNERTIPKDTDKVRLMNYFNGGSNIEVLNFWNYILAVSAGECRGKEFDGEARKAINMAIKTYTWHFLLVPKNDAMGYDITTKMQAYAPSYISENKKVTEDMEAVHNVWMESYKGAIFETVVLLSKGEVDSKKIRVEFSLEDMDMSEFQDGATYPQIKEYVLEHTGLKVSNLYISQIKRKCGIGVGKNYNLPKSEDSRQPQCPQEKEKAIREAFKYFGMI